MTTTKLSSTNSISYTPDTVKRAEQALFCCPFGLKLFVAMGSQGVPLLTICGETGVENGYTQNIVSELGAEAELAWLPNSMELEAMAGSEGEE